MQICLTMPVSFSHIGQRTVNQDTLFPAIGTGGKTPLFIICDGMGGADKGEVASQLLCDAVAGYIESMGSPILDSVHLRSALDIAYRAYLDFLNRHPLVNRMGSTLALLQFHEQGATVAHLGDSRVYQIRAGKVIFQTSDHRQVNDMVEAGIITAAQAATHPWRNRLSRAVTASAGDTDKALNRATAECICLTDIQPGDYFFICTDGVQEQIDNHTLEDLLNQRLSDAEKVDALLTLCHHKTKDNYSGHLVGVSHVSVTEPASLVHATPRYAS